MHICSQTMASFEILQDDENPMRYAGKVEDVKISNKRAVLRTLNSNSFQPQLENKKYSNVQKVFVDTSKENPCKPCHSKIVEDNSNCITELKKPPVEVKTDEILRLKDGLHISKKHEKHRTPLKDIKSNDEPMSTGIQESTVSSSTRPSANTHSKSELPESIKAQLQELHNCIPYQKNIYDYLCTIETKFRPKAYYMKRQPDITYSMRTILVDWLIEVGEEYKLHNESIFMAVALIDRFLSSMAVVRAKLQLLGTSAMFIAAKFEEIYPPSVSEFTYITDDTYSKKQVLRMEHLILKVLSFDLSSPTLYTFVTHICAHAKLPEKVLLLAMYICELTLMEGDPYLEFNPSHITSGAIALARHCLGYHDIWPSFLSEITNYSLPQLATVVQYLNKTHEKSFTSAQAACREKYKTLKYHYVSHIPHKKLVIRIESPPAEIS